MLLPLGLARQTVVAHAVSALISAARGRDQSSGAAAAGPGTVRERVRGRGGAGGGGDCAGSKEEEIAPGGDGMVGPVMIRVRVSWWGFSRDFFACPVLAMLFVCCF